MYTILLIAASLSSPTCVSYILSRRHAWGALSWVDCLALVTRLPSLLERSQVFYGESEVSGFSSRRGHFKNRDRDRDKLH